MSRSPKKGSFPEGRNPRRQRSKAPTTPGSTDAMRNSGGPPALWTAVRSTGKKDWLFAAALVAAVFLAYQPAWHGGLLWDDQAHVTRPELQSWHGLARIWCDLKATQQYYPLLHSGFWLEHKLWGDATLGYHLVNLLLHVVAALMTAVILRRLEVPGAYLAAAIFALHPVHVESVAWITELKNALSAVFYLSVALVYLRFDRNRTTLLYLSALGLFALGLLSKTVTATLPAALLVVFWWQRGRLSWRHDVLPLLPFFALGAGAGVFTALVERRLIGAEGADFDFTIVERCLIAGRAIWFYLGKLFWPADLVFIYPRWHVSQAVWWQYLFPLAALLLVAGLWTVRRRWRGPLAALLFFAGTLFPVLGFCNVYPFIYSFVADHFQYLASLGIIALASAGAATLLDRWRLWGRWPAYCLCGALLMVLTALTFRQSRMYTDVETLYQTTIAQDPACWMAHNNLGVVLAHNEQTEEAMAHYREALKIKPDYVEASVNLGVALAAQGRTDEAISQYQEALNIKHDDASAHCNLGVALASQGRTDEAVAQYQEALDIKHDYVDAHCNLGVALANQGRIKEAIAHYRAALNIKPDDSPTLNNLAWLLATCPKSGFRNGAEAVKLAERAFHLPDGLEPTVLDTLAAAYAEAGRFPEAVQAAQKALDLAKRQNNGALAERVKARLRLYEARTPYRQPSAGSTAPAAQPQLSP